MMTLDNEADDFVNAILKAAAPDDESDDFINAIMKAAELSDTSDEEHLKE